MTQQTRAAYEGRGFLAVEPSAFLEMFATADNGEEANTVEGGATIIEIYGPLEQHRGWCWDSYESIGERVKAACAAEPQTVILKLASPGGDAHGCFDLAYDIRKQCAKAGKKLLAYVEERACSAAYAIATAAQAIYVADTAIVGSIGVLCTRPDHSEQTAARGIKINYIASGARKADGHPDLPMSEAELASTQRMVDGMAGVFFALVKSHRGLDAKALEAECFHGADAVARGLADEVISWADLLDTHTLKGAASMADDSKIDEARAALKQAAEGDGPDAEKARKALAALGDDDSESDDKDKDKEAESDKDEDAESDKDEDAESDDKDESAEDEDEKPKAVSGKAKASIAEAYKIAARAEQRIAALEQKYKLEKEQTERASLMASRPDFSKSLRKTLASAPLSVVRDIVRETPRNGVESGVRSAQGAAGAKPTPGADDGRQGLSPLDAATAEKMDRDMGLASATPMVERTPHRLRLGATTASQPGKGA